MTDLSPETPGFQSVDELNEACANMVQNAAKYLAGPRQIAGSFDTRLMMCQAVYQCLQIQSSIQHMRERNPHP